MARSVRVALALVSMTAGVVVTGVLPHARAQSLDSARAQAAALSKTVNRLQTRAEVATENYDAAEGQLTMAVAERGQASQQLSTVQTSADNAEQSVANNALALYEGGGDSPLLASVVAGDDLTEVASRFRMAGDVIAYQHQLAVRADQTLAAARALSSRDTTITRDITQLQITRQAAATRVQSLLAAQQAALTAANGTVRRIMRADEAAAAARSAAAFDNAVTSAGGVIDTHGTTQAPNSTAADAIAAAQSRLGVPYVWGATGPDAFDCSGLTQWSYAHAGITLPRTAAEQWNAGGPHPSLSQLEPGDLLFWALNTSEPSTIHHVAIYIGRGLMIAAPHTGENVQVQPVYLDGYIGAMRPWAQ